MGLGRWTRRLAGRVCAAGSKPGFLRAGVPIGVLAASLAAEGMVVGAEAAPSFSREVLPILSDSCFACHGPDEKARKAKLRLDTEEGAAAALKPGDPAGSELYRRLVAEDPDERMPPVDSHLKVTPGQVETIRRWIESGAGWGRHWAFEPLQRPLPPGAGPHAAEERNGVDRFVFERLAKAGLEPAPEAGRGALIRRVTLSLTGLPPEPEAVAAFLADESPESYERLVDRLLDSPAYGERMAWDWLDAARYADSNGYQGDSDRTMWPWRDWVVEAFNRNMPYDQFTVWQLAGDLLPEATFEQRLATGFARNHMINGEGGRIPEENRVDYVMDMAETVGTVWLGLTFNCCRCHDHKYDPLTRRDYFGMFAFFNQTPVDGGGGNPQTPPVLEVPTEEQEARRGELAGAAAKLAATVAEKEKGLKDLLAIPAENRNSGQLDSLQKFLGKPDGELAAAVGGLKQLRDQLDQVNRAIPKVMVMADMEKPRATYLLERGQYDKRGDEVGASVPASLPALPPEAPLNRLGLAQWIVSPTNPLTARVTVNRFWQQLFGVGLVKTSEDFGVQAEIPANPELLDWLAAEFVGSGWDVKRLMRLMVTSAAYRRDSRVTAGMLEIDPANRLLARGPRHRMPFWMIRDQALASSGLLQPRAGGAPAHPYQPAGVWEDATFGARHYPQAEGEGLYRRSLYAFWRRIIAPPMFFDNPSRQVCTVKQPRTNTPLQALALMNDPTYVEAARALGALAMLRGGESLEARLEFIGARVLARPLTEGERGVLAGAHARLLGEFSVAPGEAAKLAAVGDSKPDPGLDLVELAAMTGVATIVLNLDEAVTHE